MFISSIGNIGENIYEIIMLGFEDIEEYITLALCKYI